MIRMVRLDPTGNITCLVTRMPAGADEAAVTRALLSECEQVAYLEPPRSPQARARVRLMGGEFCGNAAMAAACWLAREDGIRAGEERVVPLEVSGADGVLVCRARRTGGAFEGTAPMPSILQVFPLETAQAHLTAVRMQGILHLVLEDLSLPDQEAETLLRTVAGAVPDEAVGLLHWDRRAGRMVPLVYVRGSGTLVWETGCGSGSAAVGAVEALRLGDGVAETAVGNPGGIILVRAEVRGGAVHTLQITGRVRLGTEEDRDLG